MLQEIIVDSFAGGGGASLGIFRATGKDPDIAINHDASAITMHAANHPKTRHYTEDVWKVAPRDVIGARPVGLLWASPDCKHFSRAKGGKPVEKKIRSLAWVVVKWAAQARPRVIILENVREFEDWGPLVPRWECQDCTWKGTEGQARLARRRPACPRCESKRLRETGELVPCPDRKGLTFRRFVGRLRTTGYKVEHRVMNAADYGAPTHRRRLFLIARRDKKPIVWPEPTHGDPKKIGGDLFSAQLKPWRTAAECIDWALPCPSIFDRKKPLAEKTMERIAKGIKRFVLDNPKPFIVDMTRENRPHGADEPLGTVTTQGNRFNLVTPYVVRRGFTSAKRSCKNKVDEPFRTFVSQADQAIVTPYITPLTHQGERKGTSPDEPLPTVTAAHRGEQALIAPTLIQYNTEKGKEGRGQSLEQPIKTIPTENRFALIEAFIAKHYGGVVGQPVEKPLGTITEKDHHSVVAANMVRFNFDDAGVPLDKPMPAATSGGLHAALVYSFLVKYFGTAIGQLVDGPLHTITEKHRFGLVTVTINGELYVIVDIGMRMLTPRELARGQGFPDSYILTGTNTSQVARIGNSVSPQMAEALARANYGAQSEPKKKAA